MCHTKQSVDVYKQWGRSISRVNGSHTNMNELQMENRKVTCGMPLQCQERKSFLYRIVMADEKWIYFENPKLKKSWYFTWRSRFFNTNAKSFRQEDHTLCLVRPERYCVL
ncbi:hypothetical protein TNCT_325511 [Trichonephila clavata]|uniref:Uncharacterized protein n=1 Tax=Trichonephila clavata TaxID=2740835 RepID=A0A8X6HZI7_TRICU|nr:hypothetical protein TNCT_325511 [Trichonephila clavata]